MGLFRPSCSLALSLRRQPSFPVFLSSIPTQGGRRQKDLYEEARFGECGPPFGYSLRVYFVFFSFWKRLFFSLWYVFLSLFVFTRFPYLSIVNWSFITNKEIVGIEPTIENRNCVANSPITILAYLRTPLPPLRGGHPKVYPLEDRTPYPLGAPYPLGGTLKCKVWGTLSFVVLYSRGLVGRPIFIGYKSLIVNPLPEDPPLFEGWRPLREWIEDTIRVKLKY